MVYAVGDTTNLAVLPAGRGTRQHTWCAESHLGVTFEEDGWLNLSTCSPCSRAAGVYNKLLSSFLALATATYRYQACTCAPHHQHGAQTTVVRSQGCDQPLLKSKRHTCDGWVPPDLKGVCGADCGELLAPLCSLSDLLLTVVHVVDGEHHL